GRVLVRRGRVVAGDRRVVHRVDCDRHRRRGEAAVAVADGVGEVVGAVEVGGRGVGERAVGVDGDGAVSGRGQGGDGECVAVHVGVVGQHVHGGGGVLVRRGAVVAGDRRVVDRVDRDPDGGRGEAAVTVADGVGEAVGAVEVRGRGVGDRAVGVDGDGA